MGFFEHRIMPDYLEKEEQALARLSMANDNDRFAERMIAMLPSKIRDDACWYSDDDLYESRLWDIEPEVQVAGINKTNALVLNGVRAATIHWGNFPRVGRLAVMTSSQVWALNAACISPIVFVFGCIIVKFVNSFGAILIIVGFAVACASPWLVVYGNSVQIVSGQPLFIGVEGILTEEEVEYHAFGTVSGQRNAVPNLIESPTGSLFAEPNSTHEIRWGNPAYHKAVAAEPEAHRNGDKIFTLVDINLQTIYYFSAKRAPTVCVYVGREGGLGRYILCSERCDRNELHRETVLRMPTYIASQMRLCDWLAIGSKNDSVYNQLSVTIADTCSGPSL
jgi:hypothetical protein